MNRDTLYSFAVVDLASGATLTHLVRLYQPHAEVLDGSWSFPSIAAT